ncbi:MAG: SDR family oxidoreductase [Chromatiales bacterium]|nr:MAG: SDR family oxidoreductase [Chromatiales bacterium]
MTQPFSLDGRVALITGASSGLGRHFSQVLANAGASVVVGARRSSRLDELVEDIGTAGGEAAAVPLDVTDRDSIGNAFTEAEARFGVVDLVVNNAGVASSGRAEEMPDDDWQVQVDTNLTAVHRVACEAARRLIAAGKPGAIINVASILGLRVAPGTAAYNATKAAVIHLTKTQAVEWAKHGIRVNALCPGYFRTEMNQALLDSPRGGELVNRVPMRRIGRMDELDGPLLLLASEAGSFMTGSALVVDGGHLCSSL